MVYRIILFFLRFTKTALRFSELKDRTVEDFNIMHNLPI